MTACEPAHKIEIEVAGQQILLHEDSAHNDWCRAKDLLGKADWVYGSTRDVLAEVTRLCVGDPLLDAVCDALRRDRRSPLGGSRERHEHLCISLATEEIYHVSPTLNQPSIRTYGLDWRRMGVDQGIAGSPVAEATAVFLTSDPEFFVRMGHDRGRSVDVWGVTLRGRWTHEERGGWSMFFDPIEPDRLRLVRSIEPREAPVNRDRKSRPARVANAYKSRITIQCPTCGAPIVVTTPRDPLNWDATCQACGRGVRVRMPTNEGERN